MQSIWVNGRKSEQLDVRDRGLAYGDGLFETIKVSAHSPVFADQHFRRMTDGAIGLGMDPGAVLQLRQEVETISLPEQAVMKLILTRGVGGRGYSHAGISNTTRVIMISEMADYGDRAEAGVKARFCKLELGLNPALAGIKHLNRIEQVLARNEWHDPEIAEGIVCDCEGYLAEGTMSNLFWVHQGVLQTPLLDRCGVSGIVRNRLIDLARAAGLAVEEGRYRPAQLDQAEEIFFCNSLIDIWPVVELAGQKYPVGQVTLELQRLLSKEM
ncbi:aminodeoxychorismate lyase [Marinobacterium jannaschii]|uniref:aminodeoxychorismate lyase n=1 Tax=Marinobacterium jannaschii TaxID=64970 RepID=UPI00048A40AE|nr:aminodeoxychorismate lyase [Marinobacterium jannaschii]